MRSDADDRRDIGMKKIVRKYINTIPDLKEREKFLFSWDGSGVANVEG